MSQPPSLDAVQRYVRTYGDKLWRLSNLYKIKDKKSNLVVLKPNRIQRILLEETRGMKPIRHFTLKYRQGGVSTFWLLWYLDDTLFRKNVSTGVLAHERENLGYLFEIVRLAVREMPERLRPKLGDDSKTSLSFSEINSKIFVSLGIRSTAVHNLHVSEWCWCKDEEIKASLGAATPDANITGESTGNGVGNDGYFVYTDGKMGLGMKSLFIPWFLQEEYTATVEGMTLERNIEERELEKKALKYGTTITDGQIMYRRNKRRELKNLFPQEYPEEDMDAFMSSGKSFFHLKKALVLLREAREWSETNRHEITDDYEVWEKPDGGHLYVMGADPAEGVEGDYSVLKGICCTCRREAFRYRARVGVDVFYKNCAKWGRLYNNAKLAVELNNHGHAVILGLRENERYPNLYREEKETRIVGLGKEKVKWGWETTNLTRPLILDHLKLALEGDSEEDENNFRPEITFFDRELLEEVLSFQDVNGKYEAIAGKHDDDIFATAIALQMYERSLRGSLGRIRASDDREQKTCL